MYNIAELFPIKPRAGQVEAAESLARLLDESSRIVFTAPPGFGKTLAVLVALKATRLLPAAWRVRALTLARRVADDAALLDLRAELLPGRERICPHALYLGGDIHEWCRINLHRCQYYSSRSCPYFFYPSADVYIMSYFRRSPPRIIDVWDEAHNLIVPREVCVSKEVFIEAVAEISNTELAKQLRGLLPFFEREGEVSEAERLAERLYLTYLDLLRRGGRRTATGRLYRVLSCPSIYTEGGRLCGASIFIPRRTPAVFVSATLPFPLGGKILEIPWAKKYRGVIVEDITTRYAVFSEDEVKKYARLLWNLRKKFRKILVFATERVAQRLAKFADIYEPGEIPPEWEGVLLLHTRGRFAEGVDIRSDAVVMAGAPYPPPWVAERLRRALERQGYLETASKIADIVMMTVTLQCVGRAARSPEDNPIVILADERYKRHVELEKYFEISYIQDVTQL